MQNATEREIDIMRLLMAMWHRAWVIVLCAVVGGALAFGYTKYFVTPMYRANVSIYVDNTTEAEEANQYISGSSLSTAQQLVNTYVNIITSNTVLKKVVEVAELDLSVGQVRGMLSASPVKDTEIFRIYAHSPDPELATKVVNAVAEVAPGQISLFLSGSSTKIIDYAEVPGGPYSPNYSSNISKGIMLGAVLAAGVICLIALFDTRIRDEDELEHLYEYPVLGSIPAFDAIGGRTSSYDDSRKAKKKEGGDK